MAQYEMWNHHHFIEVCVICFTSALENSIHKITLHSISIMHLWDIVLLCEPGPTRWLSVQLLDTPQPFAGVGGKQTMFLPIISVKLLFARVVYMEGSKTEKQTEENNVSINAPEETCIANGFFRSHRE